MIPGSVKERNKCQNRQGKKFSKGKRLAGNSTLARYSIYWEAHLD